MRTTISIYRERPAKAVKTILASQTLNLLIIRELLTTTLRVDYYSCVDCNHAYTQEVDVVFRPMSSEVYDDVILFKMLDGPNAGGFNVPVRALLPTLQVT